MHDMLAEPIEGRTTAVPDDSRVPLSKVRAGDRGVIVDVRAEAGGGDHGVSLEELQRRLLEFGFVEGAGFEGLLEGLIFSDPMAIRLDDMRVALRRRDAAEVWVRLEPR